ncbi:type II CRISPR-associated endonuclease Cas1 [Rhodopseudomonas palustris]|uniref:CRISPR-associated endonuclease Cas1 n=1 Tax=Rhodopseudomonas palustris (strain BisB18) TaxID=316056 RepID=Q20XX5_RHOPB
MAWRGLHLTQAARLSLADGQVCVRQDAGEVRLALEDIAWIVIDTPQATLSSALMSACMDAGVVLIFTDERHTPSGVALPFHRHHRQGAIAKLQFDAKDGVKRRLWQAIIRRKILNQAASLSVLNRQNSETLAEIARHVEPGDPENVEARAARFYWGRLFGDFVRDDEGDLRNKMLNYGYAVMRAGVARALVACGFLPAFGLKHESAANAFNLADDIVEPFRPFVDGLAWTTLGDRVAKNGDLTLDDRRAMAGVLLMNGRVGDAKVSLLVAAEMASASLCRALEFEKPALLELPELERIS